MVAHVSILVAVRVIGVFSFFGPLLFMAIVGATLFRVAVPVVQVDPNPCASYAL